MHRQRYLPLALVAGLMTVATPVLAQTETAPKSAALSDSGRRMMDPISRMLEQREQLKLTDDQVGRLEEIRAKYQGKYKDQLEEMRRSREARSPLRAGMDSARPEVAALLPPEQEKQMDAMREQWRRQWREGHRGRHHGRHDDHTGEADSKDG